MSDQQAEILRTVDGVVIEPGMKVWVPGGTTGCFALLVDSISPCSENMHQDVVVNPHGVSRSVTSCWSTRAAFLLARIKEEEKKHAINTSRAAINAVKIEELKEQLSREVAAT